MKSLIDRKLITYIKLFGSTIGFLMVLTYLTVFWLEVAIWLKPFSVVFHVIAFFILTILMLECSQKLKVFVSSGKNIKGVIMVALLSFVIGLVIETLQFPTQRDADFMDLILNGLGIFMASMYFLKMK